MWQFHLRRVEIRGVIQGQTELVRSNTDSEDELDILYICEMGILLQGERHRFVRLEDYALKAEIWQSIDFDSPSEGDIVRFQDYFGR